jgi:hypothetical protein
VQANYWGANATIRNDQWDFAMANFQSLIPFGPESFALPIHVEQVFYADTHGEPGWKLVLQKEVKEKRIFLNVGVLEENGMFVLGQDFDHDGLRPPRQVPKEDLLPTSRNLCRDEAFGPLQEEHVVFNRDVGASGSSSDDEEDVGQER